MPEVDGFPLVGFVELEPGAVVGGAVEVDPEGDGVVDGLDVETELPAGCGEEHAPQTSANNPTARPMEVGPFTRVVRHPLLRLRPGIVGEMSMTSRLAGAINNPGDSPRR
jgi:hypothetical protein